MTLEDRPPVAPLLVCLVKTNGRMSIPVMHDRRCFSRRTTELLVENLVAILERMLTDVATPLKVLHISVELISRLGGEPNEGGQ
jgi:polyketide synthase PksL